MTKKKQPDTGPKPIAIAFTGPPGGTVPTQVGDVTVPERVGVTMALEDHGLDVSMWLVVEDGTYAVDELAVRRRPGARPINYTRLRDDLELQGLVDVATTLAAAHVAEQQGADVRWDALTIAKRPHRRWAITDEHLQEVAQVYRDGHPAGTETVAKHFHTTHRTAGRWAALARERGYLPATRKGKGAI